MHRAHPSRTRLEGEPPSGRRRSRTSSSVAHTNTSPHRQGGAAGVACGTRACGRSKGLAPGGPFTGRHRTRGAARRERPIPPVAYVVAVRADGEGKGEGCGTHEKPSEVLTSTRTSALQFSHQTMAIARCPPRCACSTVTVGTGTGPMPRGELSKTRNLEVNRAHTF